MGAKFLIKIPPSLDEEISGWGLPDGYRSLIEDRLRNDLALDPVSKLVRVIGLAGERLNVFSFTIPDPPVPKQTWMFAFHFLYSHDEKHLLMVAAEYEPPDSGADDSQTPVL